MCPTCLFSYIVVSLTRDMIDCEPKAWQSHTLPVTEKEGDSYKLNNHQGLFLSLEWKIPIYLNCYPFISTSSQDIGRLKAIQGNIIEIESGELTIYYVLPILAEKLLISGDPEGI